MGAKTEHSGFLELSLRRLLLFAEWSTERSGETSHRWEEVLKIIHLHIGFVSIIYNSQNSIMRRQTNKKIIKLNINKNRPEV